MTLGIPVCPPHHRRMRIFWWGRWLFPPIGLLWIAGLVLATALLPQFLANVGVILIFVSFILIVMISMVFFAAGPSGGPRFHLWRCEGGIHVQYPQRVVPQEIRKRPSFREGPPEENPDGTALVVRWPIQGRGSAADVDRLHALQTSLNEILEKAQAGICEGSEHADGSMALFLFVKDPSAAAALVTANSDLPPGTTMAVKRDGRRIWPQEQPIL
jgi:hypothetical protein